MADGSVTERRLRPIHDAIASNNWKQALKECEKWQKKGEKSDKFYALKAYVLVNQPDPAQIDKGKSETLQLCARNPSITDLDTIHILQDALRDLSLEAQEGPKLWERAAAARPSDKAIVMTWLNQALEDSQWQIAQKAAMALRKAFPNERIYDFWNMLLCFLVERDEHTSEKERLLFGTLAYRLMSKAAEGIPTTTHGVIHPGKVVAWPEEIALLVHIYLATGHCKEAADLLTGPTLNLRSSAGLQDPQLMMTLLLQCLSAPADEETKFNICRFVLGYPAGRTDDRLWSALRHLYEGGDDQMKARAAKLMEDNLPQNEIRYRAFLATHTNTDSDAAQRGLLFCKDALARPGPKPHVFKDLHETLQTLDGQQVKDFLSSIETSSSFSQTFALKVSRLCSPTVPLELYLHASTALSIYAGSLASGTPALEASIIAALTLVQVYLSTGSRTPLLRATAILELSHARHEDYFPISVLLVAIYRHLGLFSLAFSAFVKLSIKNLQWESVGHLILTRIGTLHPHRPRDEAADLGKPETAFEPAGALDGTLQVCDKIVNGIGEAIKRGLREGSYQNVVNAMETRRKIERSLWRRICAVEEQKVARMTGDSTLEQWQTHDQLQGEQTLSDQRDSGFRPHYSNADKDLWVELDCGPTPKEGWLNAMVLQERLFNYFRNTTDKDLAEREWEAVKATRKQAQESLSDDAAQAKHLTTPEKAAYNTATLVVDLVEAAQSGTTPPSETIAALEKVLCEWIKPSVQDESTKEVGVGWSQLHHWYVGLELNHLAFAYVSWAENPRSASSTGSKGKKGKGAAATTSKPTSTIPKEKIEELQRLAGELKFKITEQAVDAKVRLAKGGVLGSVLEQVMPPSSSGEDDTTTADPSEKEFNEAFAAFIDDMGGEVAVEALVGRWLASWEDACEGVLAVPYEAVAGRKRK